MTGHLWNRPKAERVKVARGFVGDAVAVRFSALRQPDALREVRATLITVAMPVTGAAAELVILAGDTVDLALSLATVSSIELLEDRLEDEAFEEALR